jgi:threonine dehydratase
MNNSNNIPTFDDINRAVKRIQPHIHRTPVLTSSSINNILNAEIYFKCENFQKVGAFKMRGASNAVFSLSDKIAKKGVATHSSGNHAAALALAARRRNIKAYIVMPRTAPEIKKQAVQEYGAQIIFCEPTLKSREETLEKLVEQTGAVFIHPYNNHKIIAGQATAALELYEDFGGFDYLIAPVGGGGLLSGTALVSFYLSNGTQVVGAEPKAADDACRSLKEGRIMPSVNPQTIADGLRTSLGSLTFPIIYKYVYKILTTNEDNIIRAMRLIWERMKIIVEPSSAVALAVLLEHGTFAKGKKIGIIISGGNVDLQKLPWK